MQLQKQGREHIVAIGTDLSVRKKQKTLNNQILKVHRYSGDIE